MNDHLENILFIAGLMESSLKESSQFFREEGDISTANWIENQRKHADEIKGLVINLLPPRGE